MKTKANRFRAALALIMPTVMIVACVVGYFYRMAQNTSMPRRVKLAECTNQIVSAFFPVPKGMLFHIVLGGADEFSGSGVVYVETNKVQEFHFDSTTATPCNWLDNKGYSNAHILNWNTEPRLQLTAGTSANITVSFERPPPTNATLWISFVQRYADLKKDRAEGKTIQ
jgi:hypothetical protein